MHLSSSCQLEALYENDLLKQDSIWVSCQLSWMYQDFLAAFKNNYKNILFFFSEKQTLQTKKFTCVLMSSHSASIQVCTWSVFLW